MTKETQRQKILRILSDYQPHCLTWEMFCKDDRTRISELRKLGYIFDETLGNCHDPKHHHGAGLKLRRLINNPLGSQIPVRTLENAQGRTYTSTPKTLGAQNFLAQWKPEPKKIANTLF